MRQRWLLAGAIAIIVAIVMVASPYGQVLLEEAASEGSHGMATLGYAFSAIFPGTVSLGSVSSHQSIVIGVSLPLRNSAQLSSFLQQVSTPGSPEYRHYLTPAEFTNTYSPSLSSYQQLEAYFQSYGLTLQPESNRLVLGVTGSPTQIGAAFHTSFSNYRMPEGQVFFGPTLAPQLPSGLGVTAAYGFTNALYNQPASLLQPKASTTAAGASPLATCPNGDGSLTGFNPTQIRDAYGVNTLLSAGHNGAGEKVAIVDAYDMTETQTQLASDLSNFDSSCAVGAATVNYNYPVKSTTYNSSSADNGWGGEEVLDMDWSHSMAPSATLEMTFSPNAGVGLYEAVDWLVTGANTNTISLSWGEPDVGILGGTTCSFQCNASTDGSYAVLHPVIEAATAEGISVFVASGDCGAADGTNTVSTDYPASDEDATGVGGTVLTMSGTTYTSETAWSGNGTGSCSNTGGAGGGWAPTPQPWYQSGTGVKNNGLRGVPDVGITAGSWLDVYQGGMTMSAGTSDAAPQWAALTAIADQIHGGDVGLINPALYAMLRSSSYSTYFHDITTGNNGYSAGVGWDPITGVGTPKAAAAIPYIASGGFLPTLNDLNATLAASTTSGAAPLTVTFTAAATGGSGTYKLYDYNFGDGNATPSSSTSFSYTYTVAGAYPASVEVYDSKGNSTQSSYVLINVGSTPFTLGLSASSTSPSVGTAITFTSSPSGGTSPYTITYAFGDGTWDYQTTATSVSHSYAQAGVFCAQATALDSKNPVDGATSSVVTIDVGGATGSCGSTASGPTVTSFTASPNPVTINTPTNLSVSATGGTTPYSYAYTGLPTGCSTTSAPSLSCTPTALGNFTVTVTVTDAASLSAVGHVVVQVVSGSTPGPTVTAFTATPNPVTVNTATTMTATVSGGTAPVTYAYTGLPSGCTNTSSLTLTCSPSTSGTFTVTFTATDANAKTSSKSLSLVVSPASTGISVTSFTATANPVTVNSPTTLSVVASGGTGTYTYAYSGLPAGCTSTSTASLGCTPSATGNFTIVVTVTDTASHTGTSSLVLQVTSVSSPLSITTFAPSVNPVVQGSTTVLTVSAGGGKTPYTYAYSGLPTGCATADTAALSCTPTTSGGPFTVTVTVTDSSSPVQSAVKQTSLSVTPSSSGGPTVTLAASPASITLGSSATFTASATGGTAPYTYAYTQLPPGCTTTNAASLTCTPTLAGTYTVLVTVTDSASKTSSANAVLTVTSSSVGSPVISAFSASPNPITVGEMTTFSVVAQGGTPPYTYTYTGLPAGCSSVSTATFNCTPTVSGIFTVNVTVTDSNGKTAVGTFSLQVEAGSSSSSSGLPMTDLLLIAAIAAVAVIAVAVLLHARKKNQTPRPPPPSAQLQPWDEGGAGPAPSASPPPPPEAASASTVGPSL